MRATDRPWAGRQLHFVGIGGAGMSGLALIADALGAQVTGSDRVATGYSEHLRTLGIEPTIGYAAANVPAGAEAVFSTAIPPDNPERGIAAREMHRADLLAEIARLRRCIAVTGTHGKTTTTGMIVEILAGAGLGPAYVVGGALRSTDSNAGWGTGEWIVIEADESDRSLLKLDPEIAVLTNAELDHHSTYASRLDLDATFREFMGRARVDVVWDRPALTALCGAPEVIAYDATDPVLAPDATRFCWRGHEVTLAVPGAHYAVNAAGALSASVAAGVDPAAAVAAIAGFRGAHRRLELLGRQRSGAFVYDSYAHHPTEVAADIAALRPLAPRRLVAVFQPHLYSRTRALARDFGRALSGADAIVVLPIYQARERPEDYPGVSAWAVAAAAADEGPRRPVAWMPGFDAARSYLDAMLRDGDLCLMMGAGNVDSLARSLLAATDGADEPPASRAAETAR